MVDPKYQLKYIMDFFISKDKTLRFLTTDISKNESRYSKLYFKGEPKDCVFFNQMKNPSFSGALEDCKNHNVLINRLYNRSPNDDSELAEKDKPIYKSIRFPQCLSGKDPTGTKTHFMNIFGLPSGEDLKTKCLLGKNLTKARSCIIHLRNISKAVLKTLTIFNSGNRFFKHANLYPHNIFLYEKRDVRYFFIDNMLFDSVKYDDKNDKPFKTDFNLLADSLVQILAGSGSFKLNDPKSTFDIYSQIRAYFIKKQIPVALESFHLNMPKKFMASPKLVTFSEVEYLLRDTFFNFIYRLKCTATNKAFRFVEIEQAMKHGFLITKQGSQTWDSLPADY
jgi:hypothetical protein